MKQIILLEDHEVARLQKGKTLMISTQAGDVGLQFLTRNGNAPEAEPKVLVSHGPGAQRHNARRVLRCDVCQTTTDNHGKPFKSVFALNGHRNGAHSGMKHAKKA